MIKKKNVKHKKVDGLGLSGVVLKSARNKMDYFSQRQVGGGATDAEDVSS